MIIELNIDPPHEGAGKIAGLLVNEPPNTYRQRFVGFTIAAYHYEIIREVVSNQRAYIFNYDYQRSIPIGFHFTKQDIPSDIFADFDNDYTALEVCVEDLCDWLCVTPECEIATLAAAVSNKFRYGSKNARLSTPTLFPGKLSGNCIDINTLFLACLRRLRHKAAYLSGYYFPTADTGSTALGVHCWLGIRQKGRYQEWDIAQCLQAGLEAPLNDVEPLGGIRAAFSYGRGLQYVWCDRVLPPISHAARPHWLLTDGTLVEATVEARLLRAPAAGGHSADQGFKTFEDQEMQPCRSVQSTH